ncbi:MAG: efflux RND transporter periplasmic adaptor subunit, partial [Rickettsiales bacterium]|nr:efflux RND transporter periplasmic adaptor subunit [Rickettsiales bacterium]
MAKDGVFGKKRNRSKVVLLLLVVIPITFFVYRKKFSGSSGTFDEKDFDIEDVSVGRIDKVVAVTGSISPVDVVKVGSLVTGVIERVYVDFNDVVKKGQDLVKLETDILERELEMAKANVEISKSRARLAKLEAERSRELYKKHHIAKSELDKYENELKVANETVKVYSLKYEAAKISLEQAHITSPVSGTVTVRHVDEGQTVVATSAAPLLLEIAKDLKQMQIEASIPESDIGMIRKGMDVTFTVDAYKNKIFKGIIEQIRLNAFSEQSVVVYNVIIKINNDEELLLPGMTALVSITVKSVENVLKVPNSVFRFKPSKEARKVMGLIELSQSEKDEIAKKIKTGDYAYVYSVRSGGRIEGI